jgi:hypothetical protein
LAALSDRSIVPPAVRLKDEAHPQR